MIIKTMCLSCVCFVLMAVSQVTADTNLVITDYSNGILTWTNVNSALYYSVEWRPSLTGSNDWTGSFRGLQDLQSANGTLSAPAPMFYRIVGTDAPSHTLSISSQSSLIPAGYYAATDLAFLEMDLTADNIRSGVSIFGIPGNPNVVNTASGDAQQAHLLAGKKAWADGTEVAGSMPNRGAVSITPGTAPQSIPVGYHNGAGTVQGDADLISANIRAGTSLFGVAGSSLVVNTDSGDALAGDLMAGKKAWVDGAEVTGSMPNRGATVIMPGTAQQTIQNGYHNGAGYVAGDPDLAATNILLGTEIFGIEGLHGQYHVDGFPSSIQTSLWDAYDPGANGVGVNPEGFQGAVFDGRYVYFIPLKNTGSHGEVLRLDTLADFGSTNAWDAFIPGANGIGVISEGYTGGVFDGRYVYFAAEYDGSMYHGEVLRLDTQTDFNTTNAWTTYTPNDHGVGDHVGYQGAVYDGRFVYFVPNYSGVRHGEVLRYDTQAPFHTTNSWAAFEASSQGIGVDAKGYAGGVFDGRFIYFVPIYNSTQYHSEVLRYDTQAPFAVTNSWSTFDPKASGISTGQGYWGGVFDGQYIYFIPHYNGSDHFGEVMRYDTQDAFSSTNAWTAYDPGDNGVGSDPDGYFGAAFDGKFIYFAPYNRGGAFFSGEVLRYNTQAAFDSPQSWSTFTATSYGIGLSPRGFRGAAFDGRHVYFCPYYNGSTFNGEVLRFDAKTPPEVPSTVSGGSFF